MKLARLELQAFGPFTDLVLDLDAGREGLHLIYGANEAGKTSTLRALEQLLYGIPNKSEDDFLHAYSELRIGATLRNGDGETLEFIRRKAAKNDLRSADDVTPLDPAQLARLLGGLDREAFKSMFGIDHPRLVAGGREIVQGGGGLGQILFAAGSGIAELRTLQQDLEKAAGDLFAPKAKNPKINHKLSEFDKARKAVKEAQLPSSEWEKHDKQLRQARQRLGELEEQLRLARHDHERLKRLSDALPLAAKRAARAERLAGLSAARLLADDFADKRRDAEGNLGVAETQSREAEETLRDLDLQLAVLGPPGNLIAHSDEIRRLQDELGAYRKAQRDLPGLQASRNQFESGARKILVELRPELTLDEVESLRILPRQQAAIRDLGNDYSVLVERSRKSREELEKRSRLLEDAEEERQSLAALRDVRPLAAVVRRVQALAHLEDDRAAGAALLESLQKQAATDLSRLGLWQGGLDDLEKLSAPAAETIDRHENELTEIANQLKTIGGQITTAETKLASLDQRTERLQLAGDVPSEAELDGARSRRESGWRLVRDAWLNHKTDAAAEAEFIAAAGGGRDLAGAYEQAVRRADDVSDRLRREADRVAQRADLAANRKAAEAELEKLAAERERAEQEQRDAKVAWAELWRPFTQAPRSPREMRSWDVQRQRLVGQCDAIRKQQAALVTLGERIQRARGELAPALVALGEPAADDGESLAALVERAQSVADEAAAAAAAHERLAKEIAEHGRELGNDRRLADAARRELADWRRQWQAAIEPLGLPADASPAEANAVLAQLAQLFDNLKEADGLRQRIAGIDGDSAQFAQQTSSLVAALASEWHALPPDAAADKLIALQRDAAKDQTKVETLRNQREKLAEQLDRAKQAALQARSLLTTMCREAGCHSPDELPELESISSARREAERELQDVDEQLLALAGGADLEAFLAEVGSLDPDAVPSRLDRLAGEINRLDTERHEVTLKIGDEQGVLARMDAGGAAAEAADRAQSLLAELSSDVEEYARLRLASAVLNKAIERYREKNQGPVLERASRLFAKLTAGSFAALRADFNDQGEPVLVGLRAAGGSPVNVDCMSDGTADQLYLALRLASLETYLDEKEPIPFIVDDILIKFDNDRSAATLEALAELSCRTQVIFFTHHEHLLDLAERRLAPGEFFVHRLPRAM